MPRHTTPSERHGHAAAKPTVDELLASRARLNKASADFLKVDLETALTFSGIALQSENPTKKERNRRAARKAYDTILRLAEKVNLSEHDAKHLSTNLKRLKSELTTLGEAF